MTLRDAGPRGLSTGRPASSRFHLTCCVVTATDKREPPAGERRDDDATAPLVLAPVEERGAGDVWSGRLDGEPVVVRRLEAPLDARARAHGLLLARRLLEPDTPSLVRVRSVRATWQGFEVVLDCPPVALALASLLERRRLAPTEVVAVGLAVSQALHRVHGCGLTHGRLQAADILIAPDGSALLTGHGIAGVLGSAGRPEDDVRDLAMLLLLAAEPDAAGRLDPDRTVDLNRTADLDRTADLHRTVELPPVQPRPDPLRDLLSDIAGSAEAVDARTLHDGLAALPLRAMPVRLGPRERTGLPVPRPAARTRRLSWLYPVLPSRSLRVLGMLVPGALGLLLLAGWLGASSPSPDDVSEPSGPAQSRPAAPFPPGSASPARLPDPPPPGPSPPGPPPPAVHAPAASDWRSVLTGLEAARAGLFAAPDEQRVAAVDAPGSSAYADDLAAVRALRKRHVIARGVQAELRSVTVRSAGSERADLEIVDVLPAHQIVSGAAGGSPGAVLEERPGRAARTSVVTLVRVGSGWRVAQIQSS
jgi:eukaryotic-like serine/threonine-protein kinase